MSSDDQSGNAGTLERDVVERLEILGLLEDPDMCNQMLEVFLSSCGGLVSQLEEAVAAQQAEACMSTAHALKGASRNLGANGLSDVSYKLECIGREEDMTDAESLLAAAKEEYVRVEDFVAKLRKDLEAGVIPNL